MTHESLTCGQLVGSPSSDGGIIIGWYEAGNDSSGRTKSSVRWKNHSSQLEEVPLEQEMASHSVFFPGKFMDRGA